MSERPRRRACACGTTRNDKFAVAETEHTILGNLYTIWGGTSIPIRVNFRCIKCDTLFDSSTNKKVCWDHK